MTYTTPTLAIAWFDLIIFGIIGLSIISRIAKKAKAAQSTSGFSKPRPRMLDMAEHLDVDDLSSSPSSPSSDMPSLDELATHRRQKLQELASQRRSAKKGLSAPTSTGPSNLTLAQRIERARAKAQYELRAQQLRRAQASAQSQPTASTPPTASPSQQPYQAPRRASKPRRPRSQRSTVVNREPTEVETVHTHRGHKALPSERQSEPPSTEVFTIPSPGARPTTPDRIIPIHSLTAHSLRQAVILREILDPPLALRADQH